MKKVPVLFLSIMIVTIIILMLDMTPFDELVGHSDDLSDIYYEGGTFQPEGDIDSTPPVLEKQLYGKQPRGPYIVIDRYCNRLYLRTADTVLLEAMCSTGSGGELIDSVTNRKWKFETPTGIFTVTSKLKNPWWRKPDWAFIEEGIPIPKNNAERFDDEMMGDFAIGFGDGYFVHGTIYERLLGTAVTHGCVRLASDDLKKLYDQTQMGMRIYVY